MKLTALPVDGAFVMDIEPVIDARGFFARCWCERDLTQRSLVGKFVQCSVSHNNLRGTLRGLHYQVAPHGETKLIRCTAGAIFDVIVDLRPGSPTRLGWAGVELTAGNHRMLYVPEGCAHGFQTLTDNTEVEYQISAYHAAGFERGCRWNDPAFGIAWPLEVTSISDRDSTYEDYAE